MKKLIKKSFIVLSLSLASSVWALSPPNISTDIHWTDTGGVFDVSNQIFAASFEGVIDIAAAYNNGRRQEEIQLGLTANTLGELNLPSQAGWDKMTDDAKGLWIINEERQDRAGMQIDVLGLPLAGIESHMDNISKNYGDLLHNADTTGHYQPSGNNNTDSPFIRINNDADIGGNCHEFIARGENLAYFATSGNSIPLPLERAIYGFIYDDASSNWGHREAALLQDDDLNHVGNNPQYGFTNNHTGSGSEGYLGVYVRSSADYKPFSSFASNFGSVVVMNFFDPIATALIDPEIGSNILTPTCHYNVTLSNTNIGSDLGKVPTINLPDNKWMQIGLNTQPAAGSNTVADIIGDDIAATYTYEDDWIIYSYLTDTNAYKKLSLTDIMLPGIGYWLIQATGAALTIDIPGSSSGVYVTHTPACASTEGCFEIPLQINTDGTQWQMIGYPFRDNRNINGLRIVTSSGDCATGCTLAQADEKGLTSDRLWHYDGSVAYEELSFEGTEQLEPWDGAWFATLPALGTEAKMLIPANNSTGIAPPPIFGL